MGYCTENDVEKIIAQALTTATADTPNDFGTFSNLMNIGSNLDKNLISTDTVNYYIQLADSEIDAALSELYETPLGEKCNLETVLYSSVDEYNPYIVLERPEPLAAGDIVLLVYTDSNDVLHEERHEIDEIVGIATFSTVSEIQYLFPENTRILRVSYSPPIRFVSSRLAAGAIYDKYFSGESSPNTSSFGATMREKAQARLNDILTGTIILHGQHRIGRRFFNANLVDQYALPKGGVIPKEYRQIK
jgi:hypothetical protein